MTEAKRFIGHVQIKEVAPTLVMDGPVVVWSHTGLRDVQSPMDFGMFDGNPGIIERRAATIPTRMEAYGKSRR